MCLKHLVSKNTEIIKENYGPILKGQRSQIKEHSEIQHFKRQKKVLMAYSPKDKIS